MSDVAPFGTRLAAAVADRGPLCVGIDPHRSLLVDWGVGDDLDGLRRFTDAVVDALAGSVALLKPQMAFYERFGARGVAVLEDAVARIRAAGALVLLDAKRGDIGSTMDAYADYLRSDHPLRVDALTVSPYLGPESLEPARRTAAAFGGGLFVLARTSNPEAETLQHALVGERSVAQVVVDTVRGWNTPDWVVGDPVPDVAAVRDVAVRLGDVDRLVRRRRRRHAGPARRRPRRSRRPDPGAGSRGAGRLAGRSPAAVRHRTGRRPDGVPRRAVRRARCGRPPLRSRPVGGGARRLTGHVDRALPSPLTRRNGEHDLRRVAPWRVAKNAPRGADLRSGPVPNRPRLTCGDHRW